LVLRDNRKIDLFEFGILFLKIADFIFVSSFLRKNIFIYSLRDLNFSLINNVYFFSWARFFKD
jgi:hypothetical protein